MLPCKAAYQHTAVEDNKHERAVELLLPSGTVLWLQLAFCWSACTSFAHGLSRPNDIYKQILQHLQAGNAELVRTLSEAHAANSQGVLQSGRAAAAWPPPAAASAAGAIHPGGGQQGQLASRGRSGSLAAAQPAMQVLTPEQWQQHRQQQSQPQQQWQAQVRKAHPCMVDTYLSACLGHRRDEICCIFSSHACSLARAL